MRIKVWSLIILILLILVATSVYFSNEKYKEQAPSQTTSTTPNQGACYVGGCSAQICSDTPGMVSNCEYREEYTCYQKTSTCERQSDGHCGWTQTNELKVCITNAVRAESE